ncbi:7085_t:CDS:1, partial [Paraglomus occultum]
WKEKGKIQEIPAKIGDYEYLQAGFDNITLEEMLKDVFLINQTNELLIKKEKEAKSDLEKKKKELEEKTTLLEKKVIELEQTNQ